MALHIATLLALANGLNIPLGYQRESCEKFSLGWFFFVHISIPFIIFARIKLGLGWQFIPISLAGAVAGQLIGGRLKRRRARLG